MKAQTGKTEDMVMCCLVRAAAQRWGRW